MAGEVVPLCGRFDVRKPVGGELCSRAVPGTYKAWADGWKAIGPRVLPVAGVQRGRQMKTLLVVTIDGILFY